MMRVVFQDSTLSIQEEETERESDGERERGVGGAHFNASSNTSLLGTGWVTGAAVDMLF